MLSLLLTTSLKLGENCPTLIKAIPSIPEAAPILSSFFEQDPTNTIVQAATIIIEIYFFIFLGLINNLVLREPAFKSIIIEVLIGPNPCKLRDIIKVFRIKSWPAPVHLFVIVSRYQINS